MKKIRKTEKAYYCRYFEKDIGFGYCRKIQHELENTFAISCHCSHCRYFKLKRIRGKKNELVTPIDILA